MKACRLRTEPLWLLPTLGLAVQVEAIGCHLPELVGRGSGLRRLRPKLLLHHLAKIPQRLPILVAELTRLLVHDAESADVVAAGAADRLRGVESDARLLENKRVLRESRVQYGVFDHEDLAAGDGVSAKRQVARRVGDWQSLLRLEPLLVALDQRDAGERHGEDALRHACDLVEALLGRGITGVAESELDQPLG